MTISQLGELASIADFQARPSVGGEQALKALRLASLIEQMALDGRAWKSAIDANSPSCDIVTV